MLPKFIFSQVLIVLTSVKMCGLFTVSGLLQECGNTVSKWPRNALRVILQYFFLRQCASPFTVAGCECEINATVYILATFSQSRNNEVIWGAKKRTKASLMCVRDILSEVKSLAGVMRKWQTERTVRQIPSGRVNCGREAPQAH